MEHVARLDYFLSIRLSFFLIIALTLTFVVPGYAKAQSGDLTYVYDELGRLVAVIDPAGDTARYTYDAVGNLLSISRQSSSIVSIINFTPNTGPVGTSVTIYGTAYSATASQNAVTFNGVAATVTSASATQIVTTVPATATTGSITVTSPAGSVTSSVPFTVSGSKAPTISGFTPAIGDPGTAVAITGTNFETTAANNHVTFRGTLAPVTSATVTSLTASAPSQPGMGRISVSTPFGTAISTEEFFIPPALYTAADIESTGWVAFGESKVATVNTVGKLAVVFFHGTAGQRVSIKLSAVTNPGFAIVINPDGTELTYAYVDTGGGLVELASLPFTGTYAVIVSPRDSNNQRTTGSMTLTLYNVPPDVTGTITADGQPVTVTTTVPGQNALLTFTGAVGQNVSLDMSGITIPSSNVFIQGPDSSILAANYSVTTSGGHIDPLTLPLAGTYQILIDPQISHVGSMTLTLHNVTASAPTITGFTPTIGSEETAVTIAGTNFDPVAANNIVTFNGILAPANTATTTSIATSVPAGATSGHIRVSTPAGSAVSNDDFFIPPSPYTAADLAFTDRMAFGESKTATVGTANKIGVVLFDGTAGRRVSLQISDSTFAGCAAAYDTIKNPDGTNLASTYLCSATGYIDTVVLPQTGTYTILVDPESTNTGSQTLLLNDVPADFTGPISPGGAAVTVTTTTPGQNAILTFSGTAGQRVSLQISDSTLAGCPAVYDTIKNPDGTNLASTYLCGAAGYIDTVVLPVTGSYTILIDPQGTTTGSQTLLLNDVPADATGTITPGGAAVTVTTTTPGQNGNLTFSGTAGQRVSLQLSDSTFAGCPAAYDTIKNPDGTNLASTYLCGATGYIDTVVLPVTGSYTILIDPQGTTTGSQTVLLNDVPADVTGTITPGGAAVTVTTTIPGQNGSLTFSGTAGQRVSLQVSDSTFAGCPGAYATIKNPDGTNLASTYLCGATGYIGTVALPVTGSYTILIDPQGTTTGSQTLLLNDVLTDVTGTITPGGAAVTVTTTTPGQNAILTFSGTAGQRVSLQLSDSTFAGCPSAYDTIKNPDGTNLASTYLCGATGYIDTVVLPVTGSYTILSDPQGTTTGSQTLLLNNVPADATGMITPGGAAVTVTTTTPGQNAILTFSGTAGQRVSLQISDSTFAGCPAAYDTIKNPDGTNLASTYLCGATGYIDTVVLPVTGSYMILIDAQGTTTGSQTLLLNDVPADFSGTITPGGASVTVTTTTPGQNAILTFSGTAGQRVSLQISDSTFAGCAAVYDTIKNPDGTNLSSTYLCGATGYIDTVALPVTGSYTILIDAQATTTGSQSLLLNDVPADVSGTIGIGGSSVIVTTTVPGQNAKPTFSGILGQQITVRVTNNTMGTVAVSLLKPDGTSLTSYTSYGSSSFNLATQTLPETGIYAISIDPSGPNIGSMTLSLTDESANLASGKQASQSSTAWSAPAERAIDGNTDGNFWNNSVTHTTVESQAWWQVDLGSVESIGSIDVWNRTDCCGDALTNFYVFVSDNPFTSTDLESTQNQTGVSSYQVSGQAGTPTAIDANRTGRYVRVQLVGVDRLSLAEVQVWLAP